MKTLDAQPCPVQLATETLRRMRAMALSNGWPAQAWAIEQVIAAIEQDIF